MMNLGQLEVQSVQQNRPQRITSAHSVTPTNGQLDNGHSRSLTSSISDAETVIRWQTPPSRMRTPEERSFETLRPTTTEQQRFEMNEAAYASTTPLVVRFDEEQIRSNEVEASKRGGKMEDSDMESSPPTPNTDDTPYIRFAIDQLTRDEELRAEQRRPSTRSSDSYPVERIVPDYGPGYMSPEREREALALVRKHRSSPGEGRLFNFNATRPLSWHSEVSEMEDPPSRPLQQSYSPSDIFIPVDPPRNALRYPDLTFVPTILRPVPMFTLSLLCFLMTAAIMFCAIYSVHHDGLVPWMGGIYGGRYFLFGFLPQILAACIFIYVQGVIAAMTRVLPYTLLAMDSPQSRVDALFLRLYSRSMLLPSRDGPVAFIIANFLYWLMIFTIPLQSCLFSVINVDGVWRWTTVQGIAWTLVALYLLALLASVIVGLFFFRRTTGLKWDARSLADIIALLPKSNSLGDYVGTDLMKRKIEIRDRLAARSDRLGYWRTPNRQQEIFYCIGEEGSLTRRYTLESGKIHEKPTGDHNADVEKSELYSNTTRFRHIPWFLRDTFVILWAVAGFIFLLALIIVSFLPSTSIRQGFPPLVPAAPNSSGFSAANFLYSFVPSLIGTLLYLLFQPLDSAVRQRQPWAELASFSGAAAESSLLLDYSACLPIQCTFRALSNRHYRVAALSLLSFVFIVIPILAGGLFFPLTMPSNAVRMLPNLTCFYIILALLILYLIGLLILIPKRYDMHLPHDVSCLAEIFSFVYGSPILDDAAFHAPRSKADLATKLMATKVRGDVNRYVVGVYRGRHGKECLGIERLGRRGILDPMMMGAR